MVLISYLPWHDTFLKLLPILGELKRTDPNGFRAFLSEAYNQGVPDCGGSLKVFYNAGQGVSKESFITCKQAFNPCFAFLSKSSLPLVFLLPLGIWFLHQTFIRVYALLYY